ncbi:Lrp/AsnC family transcriptional regulator [Actinospica durhamensis]|uniref:Lrp/AsnC family transcriptional regulator n=1 Tax=Actinospica durhamensis TaxID=1508375 RepID=A0A941EIF8_9ACTN|nr:Lrp/AsnC family transcriptional regulator [Actinospica durhamensis]MBR7831816.1 Lrp/AsnC family transcriptional regulator [Actinospica durhamensis]
MREQVEPEVLDQLDRRLIAALQCDGRLTVERAARVLGLSARVANRRLAALLGGGAVRVVAAAPRERPGSTMLLRIKVLRGKLDTITAALAARPDIAFIDMSAGGDEITAVLSAEAGQRSRLVFRQLPATSAITSVSAQTVLHVYADATDWRLDALTEAERGELTPAETAETPRRPAAELSPLDRDLANALLNDARLTAAALAALTGHPESTVRRRLGALLRDRVLITHVIVDPRRLGLDVDARSRPRIWTRPVAPWPPTRRCTG